MCESKGGYFDLEILFSVWLLGHQRQDRMYLVSVILDKSHTRTKSSHEEYSMKMWNSPIPRNLVDALVPPGTSAPLCKRTSEGKTSAATCKANGGACTKKIAGGEAQSRSCGRGAEDGGAGSEGQRRSVQAATPGSAGAHAGCER